MARRHDTTDRCGVCRRTILTGERPARFRDERQRALQLVCTLCVERAERLGWVPDAVGEDGAPAPRRMIADAAVDPDGTVARLQAEIDRLHGELRGAARAVDTARAHLDGEAQRAAVAQAEVDELRGRLERRDAQVAELEAAQETLLRARRREADPAYLAGVVAEVFNRSGHIYDVQALAARLGEPAIAIAPEGIALPRPLVILFAWGEGWRRFRVQCDLVARLFDVIDVGHGALESPGRAFRPNARLVDGRVELLAEREQVTRS